MMVDSNLRNETRMARKRRRKRPSITTISAWNVATAVVMAVVSASSTLLLSCNSAAGGGAVVAAFQAPRLRQTRAITTTSTLIQKPALFEPDPNQQQASSLASSAAAADSADDDGDHESRKAWLRWMMQGGTPRGTSKVIMREPEELGGLPRGDRYSSRDWFHNTITLPNSGILRAIRSPVLAVTSWATFLSILHRRFLETGNLIAAQHMHIPTAPHSLMMSALGLLLVFRTNSAYQRFNEGRVIWERIVDSSRDLSRMIVLYEKEIGVDKRRRIQRLLVAFPYLLRHRIRPNLVVLRRLDDEEHKRDPENSILLYQDRSTRDNDADAALVAQTEETMGSSRRKKRTLYWVDKRTLPWRLLPGEEALEKCARAQNRPLWVCDRMVRTVATACVVLALSYFQLSMSSLLYHYSFLLTGQRDCQCARSNNIYFQGATDSTETC